MILSIHSQNTIHYYEGFRKISKRKIWPEEN